MPVSDILGDNPHNKPNLGETGHKRPKSKAPTGIAWNNKEALRQLRAIMDRCPAPAGKGTQSASIRGLVAYAHDQECVRAISRSVISAVLAPNPHPLYGDDGYQESMREDATDALAWGESWLSWRGKHDWDEETCNYKDKPWDNDNER